MNNFMMIVFISLLISCGNTEIPNNEKFKKRFNNQIKQFHANHLDSVIFRIDSLTNFKWEKMYLISDNQSVKNHEKIIGFKSEVLTKDFLGMDFSLEEDECMFVFIKGEKVISFAHFQRGEERYYFNYSNIGGHTYYTPATAFFKIRVSVSNKTGRRYAFLYDAIEIEPNVPYFMDK